MTRVYELRTEYENGNSKWRALWHDYESHDECSPFRQAATCNRIADSWEPPLCIYADRGRPEPDIYSLVSHYAVNTAAKDVLSSLFAESMEFLPIRMFSGVVVPGFIGSKLGALKNWLTRATTDNADQYWLMHVLTSVAPDPHLPAKKLSLDLHYDRTQSLEGLPAFRVLRGADAKTDAEDQIWVTDTFVDACKQNDLTGVKFHPVHDTAPAS